MSDLFGNAEGVDSVITLIDPETHAGASVQIYPHAFSDEQASCLYRQLHEDLDWQQREILIYGKRQLQPRLVAWHGDSGVTYRYSGQTLTTAPWTGALEEIRTRCQQLSSGVFNSVLCNLYRDGNDAMGWHADDEPELGPTPVIASVTLGHPRRFDLRHKSTGETHQVMLPHGSLLVMAGTTQNHWKHQIPRSKKVTGSRINLTYRQVAC